MANRDGSDMAARSGLRRPRISVGGESADIRGFTNLHIQCAVDHVAQLGGGAVELGEGVYRMANSLHLRSGVTVIGRGEGTILRKDAMKQARVTTFLGFGHFDVVVDHPDNFEIGEGVLIRDRNAPGFYQTVGTLVRRQEETWFIDRPFAHDYTEQADGLVQTLFPVISAVDVADAAVEHVVVEGNRQENEAINGCRGGGFFAHRSNRIAVRGVTVRNFLGEGFSFQTCDELELDGCVAEDCSGNGFHPGSGSNRFHIHHSAAHRCGGNGLFYCLRVRDGVLEDCVFADNGLHGVSIGSRDTGHMNRRLTVRGNRGAGVFFRPGDQGTAAHNNTMQECILEGNAGADAGGDEPAEIILQGQARGVRLIDNRIQRRAGRAGILIMPEMGEFEQRGNVITPPGADAIVDRRGSK